MGPKSPIVFVMNFPVTNRDKNCDKVVTSLWLMDVAVRAGTRPTQTRGPGQTKSFW